MELIYYMALNVIKGVNLMLKKILSVMALAAVYSLPVYAADSAVIKEETTPPPAEGPLTADQIRPVQVAPAPPQTES